MTLRQYPLENGTVQAYSFEALKDLLAQAACGPAPETERLHRILALLDESHLTLYLDGYLKEFCREESFRAQAIVVETNYIDRDFMREYSGFYSTGYAHTEKRTVRLHFFSLQLSQAEFDQAVVDANSPVRERLKEKYLGFVVVRPLRRHFIGRTCLKHYPTIKKGNLKGETSQEREESRKEERHYPVTSEYKVNLFGIPLKVNSVAFQEQDQVVGICAASALYALLHGMKRLYDNPLYSALEITRLATKMGSGLSERQLAPGEIVRSMPNTGLTFEQMFSFLTEVGVSPAVFAVGESAEFRASILSRLYAYLSAGIPILAYVELPVKNDTSSPKHALTVTGYSLRHQPEKKLRLRDNTNRDAPELVAHRINKVYVHDDQVGPFSKYRLELHGNSLAFRPEALKRVVGERVTNVLPYRHSGSDSQISDKAVPLAFIVPLNEKLRLSLDEAFRVVDALHPVVALDQKAYCWDIKVATAEQVRAAWIKLQLAASKKRAFLVRDLPRYTIRIVLYADGDVRTPRFEVLLDATAVDAVTAMILVVPHSDDGRSHIANLSHQLRIFRETLSHNDERAILSAFLNLVGDVTVS